MEKHVTDRIEHPSPPVAVSRPLLAVLVIAALTMAMTMVAPTTAARAATTTLYVSPSGTGSTCSSAQPCSLPGAQTAVRSRNGSMSGDIVVQLADGVYRLSAPLRLTAADSGTNGYQVIWQAAPSAHPVISGARAVTGWTLADQAKNIWQANVGTGIDTRQLYVDGALATRARTQVNRSDFTATGSGLRFGNGTLSYLNNLARQNRVELESIGSFTDRYVRVQSIGGNFITMQQPGWNNNIFGYDVFTSPHRAGPLYIENAYEFLDSPGEWYIDPTTGVLSYIPLSGQNMSSTSVELPVLQSLVNVGGTYDAPAAPHHVQRHHLQRHQLAGPQRQPGLRRPADRRLHRGQLELAGRPAELLPGGLPAVRGHQAELVSDARGGAGVGGRPHHLHRLAVPQPGPDGGGHRQRRQRARQRRRPGRP